MSRKDKLPTGPTVYLVAEGYWNRKARGPTRYRALTCWLKRTGLIQKGEENTWREKPSLSQPSRTAGTNDPGAWNLGV